MENPIITQTYLDELTYKILGAAIEVHRIMWPGLLESIYKKCLLHELTLRGLRWKCEQLIPLEYKGLYLDQDFRFDILVEDQIVMELKSTDGISNLFQSITLSYMKMLNKAKGIIINFNCTTIFKEGQKTMVNELYRSLPKQ